MEGIKLTLIQTSRDRRNELKRFVESLNIQTDIALSTIQLVFVDQGDNKDIFDSLNSAISFDYIKYKECSLSCARNIALSHVKGKYVGFPDDDCWYEPKTLSHVYNNIENTDGIVGLGLDEHGKETNRFSRKSKRITKYNHCGAISYTIFLKYDNNLRFDENLGVGSPKTFSSGEETDYLLSYMEKHSSFLIIFNREVIIHHPSNKVDYFQNEIRKMYYYSRGDGYLLKKHKFPVLYIFKKFIYPIGGVIVYSVQMNTKKVKRSYLILKGRLEGFLYKF